MEVFCMKNLHDFLYDFLKVGLGISRANVDSQWILSGYFSSEPGFLVESSLQRISSKFLLWKRNDSSVVL